MFARITKFNHFNTGSLFNSLPKRFIGSGASYQTDTGKVKIRGKLLKSRNEDMPTMLWFPEVMEPAENWEKWFLKPENKILEYRNVYLMNARNFGDSDHHSSFDLEEVANDVCRFIEDNRLTFVTVGGHGYGAKIASAFGSYHMDRTSGVICLEGGPMDHSYHEAWEQVRNIVLQCAEINLNSTLSEIYKKIDAITDHPKWRQIVKQNLIEGKSTLQWRFNMEGLARNVKKQNCDISSWNTRHGMFPGRACVQFAEFSRWVFLNTNTIPFYKFFPKLEGTFASNSLNFIQTPDHPMNHWLHEFPEDQTHTVMSRLTRFLRFHDGVHVLLADRTEVGWYGVPERESRSMTIPGLGEYTPEHLHHNYRFSDAYIKSKERRGQKAAAIGETQKAFSKPEMW